MRSTVVTVVVALSSSAWAQLPVGEPATQGIANPTVGVASDPDASSVDRNPATLGYLRSWSGVYIHSELASDGNVGGRGDGFFFATPIPFVSSLAVGLGVQLVRPPDDFPYGNLVKTSLAFAWRFHEMLSFGLQYAHLSSDKAPVAGGVDTLDLAVAGRLGRLLAWALVVRDVPAPSVGGVPLQRVYDPELALRPLGTDRVEIAAGARFGERRGDVDPHFRLWAKLYEGVVIKADVEWRRELGGIVENDVRVALGLQLDLAHVGVSGFGLFGRDEGSTKGHGFTLAARISGDRYPAFAHAAPYLERVELTTELKGRKLIELLDRLRSIETDATVAGVLLVGGELGAGYAGAEELRAALLRLRKHEKHVLAFLLHADTKGYLVATAAERIAMDPAGDLMLVGPSTTVPYFKGTADLLGIRADYVRIGPYKSAPERYMQTGPSPESRASRETYLDDLARHLNEAIGASRSLAPDEVKRLVDRGPFSATSARASKLIDEVRSGETLPELFNATTGVVLAVHDAPKSAQRPSAWSGPQIAVIEMEGDLVGGESKSIPFLGLRSTGAQQLLASIERALADSRVRAIVLRIDSPGGSSLAADLLARELVHARSVKPVVCSLGDLAASGGYYVAASCDEIFAAPSTLAGSIGIFTGKLDLSGLASKLGVTITLFERGAHASIASLFRPYSDDERQTLRALLEEHYGRFVRSVAGGRRLPESRVYALGEGRIFSGDRAISLGLVDHYGGLTDAIEAAARRAGVPATTPIKLGTETPEVLGPLGKLLGLHLPTPSTMIVGLDTLASLLPASLCLEPSIAQARLE